MISKSLISVSLGLIITCVMMIQTARADEWNEQTKVTFGQSVEIPGHTLPPGTYWFRLADSESNRNIVQIYSEDWSTLYATVMTVSSERMNPADETLLTFAESGSNGAPALIKWFYPGETSGHEFEFSKSKESELAQDKQETISVNQHGSSVVTGF